MRTQFEHAVLHSSDMAPRDTNIHDEPTSPIAEARGKLQLLKRRGRNSSHSPLRRAAQMPGTPDEATVVQRVSPRVQRAVSRPVEEAPRLPALPALAASSKSAQDDVMSSQLQALRRKQSQRTSYQSMSASADEPPNALPSIARSSSVSALSTDAAQQLLFASEESISALQVRAVVPLLVCVPSLPPHSMI